MVQAVYREVTGTQMPIKNELCGKPAIAPFRQAAVFSIFAFLFSGSALWAASNILDLDQVEHEISVGQFSNNQLEQLQKFSQANPDNARAHVLLGRLYSRYNFGEMASLEFKSALQVDKNEPDVWFSLINEYYRHKKVAEAQQAMVEAERLFPDSPRLLITKGLMLTRLDQPGEANKILEKAESIQPDNPEVHVARSQVYLKLGKPLEALRAASRAINLQPNFATAYLARAQAYLALEQKKMALASLSKGFSLDPFERGMSSLYAQEAEDADQYTAALEAALVVLALDVHFDSVLRDEKDHIIALILKCREVGMTDGQIEATIEKVYKEFAGTGHQPKFLLCMGDVFDNLERQNIGLSYYRRALDLDPNASRGWFRLGKDLEHFHKYDQALECYKKAFALDKGDPEIAQCYRLRVPVLQLRSNDLAWLLKDLIFSVFAGRKQPLD